ncbi:MAG: hypothetical protein WC415_00385 [Patescibacteria group bacterium]
MSRLTGKPENEIKFQDSLPRGMIFFEIMGELEECFSWSFKYSKILTERVMTVSSLIHYLNSVGCSF